MSLAQDRAFITVVSGLPRSGTSMMMRMLEAGGMPLVIDHERPADLNNPKGYYEYERVKSLKRDSAWLAQARGAAIKVIYYLLPDLPTLHQYRVIFMRRNLREVVASQESMLRRLGQASRGPSPDAMAELFGTDLARVDAWLRGQVNFTALDLRYDQVVADPSAAARAIADFLGGGLDTSRMRTVVESNLYRERAEDAS